MGNIFIPPLGSVIQLQEDWHFYLHDESRNATVQTAINSFPPYRMRDPALPSWRQLEVPERKIQVDASDWEYIPHPGIETSHPDYMYWTGDWRRQMVFREGTDLKIERIYLRRGQKGYDSVTFRTNHWVSELGDPLFTASRKIKHLRFWAKLDDVNQIVGKYIEPR